MGGSGDRRPGFRRAGARRRHADRPAAGGRIRADLCAKGRCLTKERAVSSGNIGKNAEKCAENHRKPNSLLTNPAEVYIIFCVTL